MTPYFRVAAAALVALVLLCWGMAAKAGTASLTWTLPTTRTDGTAIGSAPITIRIYRATTQAGLAAAPALVTTAAGATGYTDAAAPAGTVWYQATAIVGGVESARTAAVSVVVPEAAPNPPTGLNATVQVADTNAYKLRQSVDGFQFVSIGTVPAGTACLAQTVGEYAVVPRETVTLRSRFDTKPLITFARCG